MKKTLIFIIFTILLSNLVFAQMPEPTTKIVKEYNVFDTQDGYYPYTKNINEQLTVVCALSETATKLKDILKEPPLFLSNVSLNKKMYPKVKFDDLTSIDKKDKNSDLVIK